MRGGSYDDRRWLVLVIGLDGLLVAGCAGAGPARELSRETLGQIVEYEQQVREASRLLQAYYRRALIEIGEDYEMDAAQRWRMTCTGHRGRGCRRSNPGRRVLGQTLSQLFGGVAEARAGSERGTRR